MVFCACVCACVFLCQHRFTDFMVRDVKTGECYRADHLLEAALEAALENTKEPLSAEEKRVGHTLCMGWSHSA